jgi:deazaflavin-dependent oxidoreductase (nitroreductase family)
MSMALMVTVAGAGRQTNFAWIRSADYRGNMASSEEGRAQTMALQRVANKIVGLLLRAPGISGAVGRQLVLLDIVGRRSGKHYEVPVAYTHHDGSLLIGTPFAWGRNLRTGDRIGIVLQGKRRVADVRVISDEAGVIEHYAIIVRHNRNFAKFNNIGFTPAGDPDPDHLRKAYQAGARAFLLTPH